MKSPLEIKSKLPLQILNFFKRQKPELELESTLPLLEALHARLLEGHSSLPIDEVNEKTQILEEQGFLGSPEDMRPLVLCSSGDLYFKRYFDYEISIAEKLHAWSGAVKQKRISNFSDLERDLSDNSDQLDAAKLSIDNKFSIITGGPGTGKTYLLVSILRVLLRENPDLKVLLAAPTGKAAQRMTESIIMNLQSFDLGEEERKRFPQEACTIHRLLQPLPPSIHFRKNQKNPLEADFLIIDEASMIDLPLMAKLFDSIPNKCNLILIGDVDQLAPVEAGAPFASMVRHFLLPDQPQIVAKLSTNRRFGPNSSIHQLCQAISVGDSEKAKTLINKGDHGDLEFHETWDDQAIDQIILRGYEELTRAKTPAEAHQAFLKFQVLCPTHQGKRGVIAMNEKCRKVLSKADNFTQVHFSGLPIIIKQNDYGSGLFNGDIGIFLPSLEDPDQLSVWFADGNGNYRSYSPARLPPFDFAYAITIHRSQGSEYGEVMIAMPNLQSEILSRHLLYVACSRAKNMVRIHGSKQIFLETIDKSTEYSRSLENRLIEIS